MKDRQEIESRIPQKKAEIADINRRLREGQAATARQEAEVIARNQEELTKVHRLKVLGGKFIKWSQKYNLEPDVTLKSWGSKPSMLRRLIGVQQLIEETPLWILAKTPAVTHKFRVTFSGPGSNDVTPLDVRWEKSTAIALKDGYPTFYEITLDNFGNPNVWQEQCDNLLSEKTDFIRGAIYDRVAEVSVKRGLSVEDF